VSGETTLHDLFKTYVAMLGHDDGYFYKSQQLEISHIDQKSCETVVSLFGKQKAVSDKDYLELYVLEHVCVSITLVHSTWATSPHYFWEMHPEVTLAQILGQFGWYHRLAPHDAAITLNGTASCPRDLLVMPLKDLPRKKYCPVVTIEPPAESFELALMMVTHVKLGAQSGILRLPSEILCAICTLIKIWGAGRHSL